MVRLKEFIETESMGVVLFQFHYGTIKSLYPNALVSDGVEFQFHYGTIKSAQLQFMQGNRLYFNSTMVRLKETRHQAYSYCRMISIPLWYD